MDITIHRRTDGRGKPEKWRAENAICTKGNNNSVEKSENKFNAKVKIKKKEKNLKIYFYEEKENVKYVEVD